MLQKKIPEGIRLILSGKVNKTCGDSDWELSELLNCLGIEIEEREKCAPGRKDVKKPNAECAISAVLTTGTSKATCRPCRVALNKSECHFVTDISERRNILEREGCCN